MLILAQHRRCTLFGSGFLCLDLNIRTDNVWQLKYFFIWMYCGCARGLFKAGYWTWFNLQNTVCVSGSSWRGTFLWASSLRWRSPTQSQRGRRQDSSMLSLRYHTHCKLVVRSILKRLICTWNVSWPACLCLCLCADIWDYFHSYSGQTDLSLLPSGWKPLPVCLDLPGSTAHW